MKNQTRMAAGLAAALLLTAQGVAAQTHPEQEEAPNRPGFFRQLGTSLKNAGQEMIGVKPTGATASQASGNQPIYTPVSGSGKIQGLFKSDNHQLAQRGKLEWPRVALTYTEWGASLPCWTVEAKIWTSATASTTETFRTCANAAVTETDDLGDTAELNTAALWKGRDSLMGVRVPSGEPNTGANRSAGPNPPAQPFVVNVSRPGVSDKAVDVALRVAWVSGFIQTSDLHPGASGLLTPFKDSRMWIAGFKPEGNRDR
ncbi:hypothetical protein VDQ87_06665 [Xanthomonas campestris pv. campestris]|uniref:hypothetical protein n=1 Tax=Xanthomonas campestris TaxID=339 RepID=UPI002AD464DD|nr:hypothetical protein [Xanthomonas campestris]MEA0806204.1 hypothetical protein [Xanthomonas campestris pv. campestris]MEB1207226.1 hypothetical protein [Xanthomonas campestris pv. campestris]MEB1288763.1 hypothetical protein [Xanthomonas campestris pv. campestris]MEB1365419.1 hypothetical protein [Xanthomonas campestris pv. campestris]MEB1377675.1 hypothetical protein [Xanthomonas campestris pv. campestris]